MPRDEEDESLRRWSSDGTVRQPGSRRSEVKLKRPKPVRLLLDFGGGNSITVSSTESLQHAAGRLKPTQKKTESRWWLVNQNPEIHCFHLFIPATSFIPGTILAVFVAKNNIVPRPISPQPVLEKIGLNDSGQL